MPRNLPEYEDARYGDRRGPRRTRRNDRRKALTDRRQTWPGKGRKFRAPGSPK